MKSRPLLGCLVLVALMVPRHAQAGGATDVAGVPSGHVSQHGPRTDFVHGDLQPVGHSALRLPGGETALGYNGAVAMFGRCAYVGRWHDYGYQGRQYPIQVVDVRDPKRPRVLSPSPFAARMVPHAVQREIRAIDLPNFKLLTVLTFSKLTDEGALTPGLNAISFYGFRKGDCAKPYLLGRHNFGAVRPHEFYQWLDPNVAHDVDGHPRILEFVTTPLGGADGQVVDASRPDAPELIGAWHAGQPLVSSTETTVTPEVPAGLGRYSHSIALSADGTRAYVSHWDGGYFTLDSSDFANASPAPLLRPIGAASLPLPSPPSPGNTHSAVRQAGTNNVVVGAEAYVTAGGCPFGWMRVIDMGSGVAPPSLVGEYKLRENDAAMCNEAMSTVRNNKGVAVDGSFSMHNQTVTSRFVLTSWYGGGLRVIDLVRPAKPTEAGFFVPKPAALTVSLPDTPAPVYGLTPASSDDWWVSTWSYPVVRGGLIFVTDIRNGLYILRARPGTPLARDLAKHKYLEGNSNLGDFVGRA